MNSKLWIQKALTLCLVMAITASYSMVALAASSGKAVGELMVTGGSSAEQTSSVTVNGEPAVSGRAIFSSSTISTPDAVSAAINLGKAGNLQLAPNTTFTLNTEGNAIGGDLTAGSITVLSSAQAVSVKILSGEVLQLNAGQTATAVGGAAAQTTTTSNGDVDWWVYALIFGGATVGIILAATAGNDSTFGNGAITVSPVR
jgi:hypothetical protein